MFSFLFTCNFKQSGYLIKRTFITRGTFMHFLFTFRQMLLFKADYIVIKVHALPIPIMLLESTLPIELQEQNIFFATQAIANAEIMYILYELNTNNTIFPLPTVWPEALACRFTIVRLELSNTLSPQYNLFTPHANRALSLLEAHIVDEYTVPAQSELTGDWWTNLAGKQSNSFGLILPRCARQTAFSKTTPCYRIGLDSERLVKVKGLTQNSRCLTLCLGSVRLETIRELYVAFPLLPQRHFAHRLIRDLFLLSIRQLVEELGQHYVCSKWSAI